MEGDKREVQEINEAITKEEVKGNVFTMLNQNWGSIKPILPVASGGLSPLHVPDLIEFLGKDMVFQFGGGCHGHPDGTLSGAKAIRQAVEATIEGISLIEYAKTHDEIKKALNKWKI